MRPGQLPVNASFLIRFMAYSKLAGFRCLLLAAPVLTCAVTASPANSQPTTSGAVQISIGVGNTPPSKSSESPSACPNSNLIAFSSSASNLTSSFGPNSAQAPNVYLYSPSQGISLISKNTAGVAPEGALARGSTSPSISAIAPDGTFAIAYVSDAADLVPQFSSSSESTFSQAYVYISATNQTVLLSKAHNQSGNVGANGSTYDISVALAGNAPKTYRACFRSQATNLVESNGSELGLSNIFCKDIVVSNQTVVEGAMTSINPALTSGSLIEPALSADGSVLAFSSNASIIPGVTPTSGFLIYLYRFADKSFSLVSKTSSGSPVNGSCKHPSVSTAGSVVSFLHYPSQDIPNLPGFESTRKLTFVKFDSATGTYSQINSNSSGVGSDGDFTSGMIDSSGRYAVFSDSGRNLIPNQDNSAALTQVYLKDTKDGAIIQLSVNSQLQSGDRASGGIVSEVSLGLPVALGRTAYNSNELFASFVSEASNLATVGTPDPFKGASPFLYRSAISIPVPPFSKNTPLESPPDVQIVARSPKGLLSILLTFLKFQFETSASGAQRSILSSLASKKGRIRYEYTLRKVGSSFRVKKVVSRNTTTIRKLTPGRYTVRYRVIATKGRKTSKTRFSPAADVELS